MHPLFFWRHSRFPTLVALASGGMALMVTACGGAGDDGVSGNSTFAQPSSALCAQRDLFGVCAEPTSSALTITQLLALQGDESGERVRFTAFAIETNIAGDPDLPAFGGKPSPFTYALLEQPVVIGRRMISFDKAYGEIGGTPYLGLGRFLPGTSESLDPTGLGAAPIELRSLFSYGSSQWDWSGVFSPLTDRIDAPADQEITYLGLVRIQAGDGGWVASPGPGVPAHSRWVFGSCPITLKLSTADGNLAVDEAACTDPNTQAVIRFNMGPVSFKDSRLHALGSEAVVQIDRLTGGLIGIPNIEPIAVQFQSNRLVGAIYGRAAAGIALLGWSPQGRIEIVARRTAGP